MTCKDAVVDKIESDFGSGFVYCLGLFVAHTDAMSRDLATYRKIGQESMAYRMWFNGAGDHLFDMQIPQSLPLELQNRATAFRERVLHLRSALIDDAATSEDFDWATNEAKELLRAVDELLGIKTIVAQHK